jgi:DNA-binding transcriptional regulator GbsR (MarR family)
MRRKRGTGTARSVAPTQRDILRDVMLAAGKYGAWMTLRELARLTRYAEASISAQLRHLRRAECGGYVLDKRVREAEVVSSEEHFVVWEYRLIPRRLKRRRINRLRRDMRDLQTARR